MIILRRVRVGSAFKVGALITGLQYLIFGLLFLLFNSAILNSMMSAMSASSRSSANLGGASAVGFGALLLIYGCGIPFAAFFGGVSWAITAFFYNLAAGWVGGVEIQLDGLEKLKNEPY